MKKYLLALLASFMLIFTACSSNSNTETKTDEPAKVEDTAEETASTDGEVFKIGAIPDFDQAEMEEAFNDFAEYLSKEIGKPVEFVPTVDYASLVTAFDRGEIDLAWFGGLTVTQALNKVPEAEAFAQRPSDQEFKSVFIEQKGLGLKGLEDLKGKTFTFGSESSTSGHLMPRYFLTEAGINPDEDFDGAANYSGSHDKTYKLVESGAFQTGAVNVQYWEKALDEGLVDETKVEEFYRTPDFYDYNWTLNKDIDQKFGEGTAQKVKDTILNMKKEDSKIMDLLSTEEFIETKNENYDLIKEVAEQLGMLN
ncbi:putative selenate ABC transporter substrate-binding protein [Anaerococcus cruorum]|uniref:putative selenate ABC transporter substrate-binding protein n=1 Tax=Anaerococcus sp. WGS1529 TaxID=3366812 RepID=UPI00372D737D